MANQSKSETDPILTVQQVAKGVSVSKDSVLRWIASGELNAIDVGSSRGRKCYRIWKSDLLKFLDRRAIGKPATKSTAVSRLPRGEHVQSFV